MNKTPQPIEIPVRWRTCNCTDAVVPDGLIRSLMELQDPRIKRFNKEPCTHWQEGIATPLVIKRGGRQ